MSRTRNFVPLLARITCLISTLLFVATGSALAKDCTTDAFPALPDVKIISVKSEAAPVPHCKVHGVIGTETNFELLLPESWNGKFVMGGGGGFVGSVVNAAIDFVDALGSGWATVGTDTGHQGNSLGGIQGASATKGDNTIVTTFAVCYQPIFHILSGWIGLDV